MVFFPALLLGLTSFVAAKPAGPIIFVGNATTFIPSGLTACGIQGSTIPAAAFVAGVAKGTFDKFQPPNDPNPNDNTLCKQPIFIYFQDKTISAEVVEEDFGAIGEADLILSASAFKALTGQVSGVVEVDWQYTVPV